jgi:hypothetical protein
MTVGVAEAVGPEVEVAVGVFVTVGRAGVLLGVAVGDVPVGVVVGRGPSGGHDVRSFTRMSSSGKSLVRLPLAGSIR